MRERVLVHHSRGSASASGALCRRRGPGGTGAMRPRGILRRTLAGASALAPSRTAGGRPCATSDPASHQVAEGNARQAHETLTVPSSRRSSMKPRKITLKGGACDACGGLDRDLPQNQSAPIGRTGKMWRSSPACASAGRPRGMRRSLLVPEREMVSMLATMPGLASMPLSVN